MIMTAANVSQFNYNCRYKEGLDCAVRWAAELSKDARDNNQDFFNHSDQSCQSALASNPKPPRPRTNVEAVIKAATLLITMK